MLKIKTSNATPVTTPPIEHGLVLTDSSLELNDVGDDIARSSAILEEAVERRLLIVDDEPAIVRLLTNLFAPLYRVQSAPSGESGLELLREGFAPQVIIADQRMPGMKGSEFLGKSRLLLPNTVRVTLTGYTDVKEIVESINSGAIYRFVGKPWEDTELLETVRLCFEHYDFSTKHAELRAALKRVQELNKEKSDILGIVSHDLKNPISSILGMSEIMQANSGFGLGVEEYQQFAAMIYSTARNMLELVKSLLDDHRAESGHITMIPVNVAMIIRFVVEQYRHHAEQKSITLHTVLPENIYAFADEQRLQQVMNNLISNAVKYSPNGVGANVYIRLSILEREAEAYRLVRIEVQDEGPGLTEDDKTKLFGKFAQLSAQPTGGEHSTGLGLSIVKKMLEAMQGQVWCESEAGKGATFIVELPAVP